jgi:pimeloyl-ACP methyl ester carboxylesterase
VAIVDGAPAREGVLERPGASIHYQVFGDSGPTILLLPTWSLVHTDFWRRQVPHFEGRYRVVAFDGRGNGRSSRPPSAADYTDELFAEDALAVMDELEIDEATLLSNSAGAAWQLILAAEHPDRVAAAVFIAPSLPLGTRLPERAAALVHFDEPQKAYDGWLKYNRHYWHADWPGFLEFFFSRCFTEPGSEEEIRHFVSMGLETDPQTIVLTVEGRSLDRRRAEALARSVTCPVLVIHGADDAISSVTIGTELAGLTKAELAVLPLVGHEPQSRWPTQVNAMLDAFLARHVPAR